MRADTACHGVTVGGGDTATLTPAAHNVSGNLIHRFARVHRTYNPGIGWGGVGSIISNNTVRDAPHAAILGGGQNFLFEGNVIQRVAYEVDDAGAFYTGRSWLDRGNVVRSNVFESVRTRVPVFLGSPSVQGLYLDDQMSDYEVIGNTFIDCQVGMFIGGGQRNVVANNTMQHCDTAVHFDQRGHNCYNVSCFPSCPGNCDASTIWGCAGLPSDLCDDPDGGVGNVTVAANGTVLRLGPIKRRYTTPPWSTVFPGVGQLLDAGMASQLGDPLLNRIVGNVACGCGTFLPATCSSSGASCAADIQDRWMGEVRDNTVHANCSQERGASGGDRAGHGAAARQVLHHGEARQEDRLSPATAKKKNVLFMIAVSIIPRAPRPAPRSLTLRWWGRPCRTICVRS